MDYLAYFKRRSVENAQGCWIWQGSKKLNGYGQMGYHTRSSECAHRVAYLELNGPVQLGQVIRHACDNPACVNPKHLVIGTQADNTRDMQLRGRANYANACKGTAVKHLAKLTESIVREARTLQQTTNKTVTSFASTYGVTTATMSKALSYKTWKHL